MGGAAHAQHAASSVQIITADAPAKAPGKATLTQKLPPQAPPATGIPLVDQGLACDNKPDGAAGCVSPQRRAYNVTVLSHAITEAMANFRDAIQDERLEQLTEKEEGPGLIVEGLIEGFTGPVVGLAVKGASRFLRVAASELFAQSADRLALAITRLSLNEEVIKEVMKFGAKKAGKQIEGLLTSHGKKHKAGALKLLRSSISILSNELISSGVTRLQDDVEIAALSLGYQDQEFHSVSAYAEQVDLWLDRYTKNGLEDVGETKTGVRRTGVTVESDSFEEYSESKGELAWVTLYTGEFRLARMSGKVGYERFERLIDREFETAAITLYTARTGHPPTRQLTLSREEQDLACSWADRSWMGGLVGCQQGGAK